MLSQRLLHKMTNPSAVFVDSWTSSVSVVHHFSAESFIDYDQLQKCRDNFGSFLMNFCPPNQFGALLSFRVWPTLCRVEGACFTWGWDINKFWSVPIVLLVVGASWVAISVFPLFCCLGSDGSTGEGCLKTKKQTSSTTTIVPFSLFKI